MKEWDIEQISSSFLHQAEEAERYCKEVKAKIKFTSSYEHVFDEHKAKFFVYNYLHGRTFLSSRKKLLSELRRMLTYEIKPSEYFDIDRFESYRKTYINHEISIHENT